MPTDAGAHADALCCPAKSSYPDIRTAMPRGMRIRMKYCEVKLIEMFYVSPKALSRLSRADYCRVEMIRRLTLRFTWGKR
ncbi:hypothetical protein [Burkholderia dolosa]|uniref:hypothetical protein n=1 Tax=Burkholderia dolosa TaxID=152500 RepID=UPI001BA2A2AF|nr:hypothetical protein [Burkholderia dolosa]MBR8056462.1 hypothetical protein [Burkholderia dolosa]MBR8301070.1 hypothetical protein [Burkholderia dolosa]MBR8460794.1 hypothetical protein [Burkholderia dolosa]MDN7422393.1 hypothetical protein [Burkholderia dolosa]